MAQKKVSDDDLIESYRRTKSYKLTADEVGIAMNTVRVRIFRLRSLGYALPDNRGRGRYAGEGKNQPRQTEG